MLRTLEVLGETLNKSNNSKHCSILYFLCGLFPLVSDGTSIFLFFWQVGTLFPVLGLNLCPLYWKCEFLTTGLPGKSQNILTDIFLDRLNRESRGQDQLKFPVYLLYSKCCANALHWILTKPYIESSQSHVNRYCYPHFTDEKTDIQRDYNMTKVRELVSGWVRIWCASRAHIPNRHTIPVRAEGVMRHVDILSACEFKLFFHTLFWPQTLPSHLDQHS